jgi:hypothetical protein
MASPAPALDETAAARRLNKDIQRLKAVGGALSDKDIAQREVEHRAANARALASHSTVWKSWASGERPRRATIALYGDLFTLMHQIEAEQTSKPQELVWGLGVLSWQLTADKEQIPFESASHSGHGDLY